MAQYSVNRQEHYGVTNKDLHEVMMFADKDGNIINSFGAASNIPIAAGEVDGYGHINKFGATNGDVTEGTVWDGNDGSVAYPYPADNVVAVASLAEVGENVIVQGLDANFNEQTEVIAIGSTGLLTFSRIFRVQMESTTNTADVTLTMGGVTAGVMLAGLAQSLMAIYTVPAGKTGYLLGLHLGSDKASTNSRMTYRLFCKTQTDGGVFRIKANLNAAGGASLDIAYPVPLVFEEKTDIKIDVVAGQATQVSATFDIILVDNE